MIKWQWDQVDYLEKQKEWMNTYQYMKREWQNGGNEIKRYIRYSFLNWYLITEGEVLGLDANNDEEFHANLEFLFQLGKDKYWDNPYFLGIYGYMISITPYIIGDDIEFWINESNEMLIKATKKQGSFSKAP